MQTVETTRLKHWNVLEYRRMTELGILNPDERTELISGQILFRAAKGMPMYWLFVYWQAHSIASVAFPDRLLSRTDIFIP